MQNIVSVKNVTSFVDYHQLNQQWFDEPLFFSLSNFKLLISKFVFNSIYFINFHLSFSLAFQTHTDSLSLTLSLSLSHTHTHSLTHSLSLTLTGCWNAFLWASSFWDENDGEFFFVPYDQHHTNKKREKRL